MARRFAARAPTGLCGDVAAGCFRGVWHGSAMILGFGGILPFLGVIPAFIAERKGRRGFVWWIYGTTLFIFALPHALMIDDLIDSAHRTSPIANARSSSLTTATRRNEMPSQFSKPCAAIHHAGSA